MVVDGLENFKWGIQFLGTMNREEKTLSLDAKVEALLCTKKRL